MFSASESVFKEFKPFPCNNNLGPFLVKKKNTDYPLTLVKNDQFLALLTNITL